MKRLFAAMKQAMQQGNNVVLVSVIASSGSTPGGAGTRMLVSDKGLLAGTIGGGAVEYQCIRKAQKMLGGSASARETIALNADENAQLGMVCGGRVEVHFLPIHGGNMDVIELCTQAMKHQASATPFWLLTPLSGTTVPLIWPSQDCTGVPQVILKNLREKPEIYEAEGQRWFGEQIQKAGYVYIFGGGHVAQALVPVLAPLDFPSVVLENRSEFARKELFPQAQQVRLIDFDHVNDSVVITEDDYICIMTRGHQDDLLIQKQVLSTPARYIGLIGSAQKTAASFGALRKMGFPERSLARIVTPIGLSIGGRSPAEIAISIAAQLIQYRSGMRSDYPFREMEESL